MAITTESFPDSMGGQHQCGGNSGPHSLQSVYRSSAYTAGKLLNYPSHQQWMFHFDFIQHKLIEMTDSGIFKVQNKNNKAQADLHDLIHHCIYPVTMTAPSAEIFVCKKKPYYSNEDHLIIFIQYII